jgi:predicted metal-binding protein
MKPIESYRRIASEIGIDGVKIINAGSVATAGWVRMKCQFGCRIFGKSLCCPPYAPTPDRTRKIIDTYNKAILLQQRLVKGKMRGQRVRTFNEAVVRLEIEMFLDGYYRVWSMGSGPCRLCKVCNLSGPCRHGSKARPSMEGCGIDVFKTARDNGFPIQVVRAHDEEINVFGLVLVE